MAEIERGTVVTYTDADGVSEDVWNSRDGAVPAAITLAGGTLGYLTMPEDELTTTPGGPGVPTPGIPTTTDIPPVGLRQIVDATAETHPLAAPGTIRVGWPGEPAVVDAGSVDQPAPVQLPPFPRAG